MTTHMSMLKKAALGLAAGLLLAGPTLAAPGARPPNSRPKMPAKPPIIGIPNGGRQAAFQPGHGAFGNAQAAAAGGQAGQAGQFGQGGGALGGGFGGGGVGGGVGGGGALGGQGGGGFGGGGMKGFAVGGGLVGPEASYRNGVGLYGGQAALDGAHSENDSLPGLAARSRSKGHELLLSPVVADVISMR